MATKPLRELELYFLISGIIKPQSLISLTRAVLKYSLKSAYVKCVTAKAYSKAV